MILNKKLLQNKLIFILILMILSGGLIGCQSDEKPFIHFTLGELPESFRVREANSEWTGFWGYDQYVEFFGSEPYFIRLVQRKGTRAPMPEEAEWMASSLSIQEGSALIDFEPDLETWVGDYLDVDRFPVDELVVITLVLEDIRIDVVTNLPEAEAILVAEGLIPSQCLNPPGEESGE